MPTDVSPEPADGGENCACADQVSSSLFFQRSVMNRSMKN